MVKKFSKAKEADTNLLGTVKESSSQIWLAGLGAFSKAQEEGSKVFEALVKEGAGLQKKVRKFADSQVADVTNEVSGKITEATSKAAGAWDRLETVFEERVGRAVSRLGVPSKADIAALTARVEELTKQVNKLNGSKATPSVAKKVVAKANGAANTVVKMAAKAAKRPVKKAKAAVARVVN
ncbi:MAG: poly granule associated protein [Betaproteobacteria bacterium]|nr:MAG: poly granule associated protein [Betaproteobacteria bacterium]